MTLLLFQDTNTLRFFVNSISDETWRDISWSWILTSIIVGGAGVALFHVLKGVMKSAAPNIHKRIWSRIETWRAMLVFVFPLFFILSGVWALNKKFMATVQVPGLLKGALLMSAVFLIASIIVHLISPWRRELV